MTFRYMRKKDSNQNFRGNKAISIYLYKSIWGIHKVRMQIMGERGSDQKRTSIALVISLFC